MPVQAFVDDSGGKGDTVHFVMAGLLADSASWMEFSEEWSACLGQTPALPIFKMSHAASCGGHFFGVSESDRDKKLKLLARIINSYARIATASVINLGGHAKTWALAPEKKHRDPYFWPFHNTVLDACLTLWDLGIRDRFEVIFDEHVIFGPRAKLWYPVIKEVVRAREPEPSTILPIDVGFQKDDEFKPLQAADLFAWLIRKKHDDPGYTKFDWIWAEMPSVQLSNYPQYYDEERMADVMKEARRLADEGEIPSEIAQKYNEIYGL